MILSIVLIPVGFVLLIKGADALVDGASSVAKKFKISDLIIGLTIVAFGTSAPELIVCILAAIRDNSDICTGNVIGSNIANLCLILGVAGLMTPLAMQKATIKRDIPFLFITTALLVLFVSMFNSSFLISRVEAVILLTSMAAYFYCMFRTAGQGIEDEMEEVESNRTIPTSILLIAGGLAGLMVGGELIVKNSVFIAGTLGVSERMIGLSIVALGTSLPELATAVVAVKRNKADIAVGNVIGSNIMNTALVLGLTGSIAPIPTGELFTHDIMILSVACILFMVFMFTGKRNKIDRWEAAIFLCLYIGYMGYVIHRG